MFIGFYRLLQLRYSFGKFLLRCRPTLAAMCHNQAVILRVVERFVRQFSGFESVGVISIARFE